MTVPGAPSPVLADVAVVMPAYKAEATIARALRSIARQTVKPAQVIVIDDGSPDRTAEAARAMAGELAPTNLVVLAGEHRGAGAARNRGVRAAAATWIAFLDADDEWLAEKLARSLAALDEGFDFVAHDGWIVGSGGETLNACAARFAEPRDPYVTLYRKGYIDNCSVVARRADVLAAGGFDENLRNAQDFDLWLAMLKRPGVRFRVLAEPLVRYHITPGSIMSHVWRRVDCCKIITRRHAPALLGREAVPLASLLYRTVAIHAEAVAAFRRRSDIGSATLAAARLPVALVSDLGWAAGGGLRGGERPARRSSLTAAALWLWVLGATVAYLAQFRDLAGPVARLFGLG